MLGLSSADRRETSETEWPTYQDSLPIPSSDLEPSLVSGQTYVTRRRLTYVDAGMLLGLMIILVSVLPSNLIVPDTTNLGRPGLIIGFFLFIWWILVRCTSHLAMTGRQPMRWAILAFMISGLMSYAAGFLRGLTGIEANGADRMMLYFCVLAGVVLTAADGVPNWLRLRRVVEVLVWSAAVVAFLGISNTSSRSTSPNTSSSQACRRRASLRASRPAVRDSASRARPGTTSNWPRIWRCPCHSPSTSPASPASEAEGVSPSSARS